MPSFVAELLTQWENLHVISVDGVSYIELDALVLDYITLVAEACCKSYSYILAMCAALCIFVVFMFDFFKCRFHKKQKVTK